MPLPPTFREHCRAAVSTASQRDVRLRLVGHTTRKRITDIVVSEWGLLAISDLHSIPRFQLQATLRNNSRIVLRKERWGFIPLPIILFVAEIIIRIILEKWFDGQL